MCRGYLAAAALSATATALRRSTYKNSMIFKRHDISGVMYSISIETVTYGSHYMGAKRAYYLCNAVFEATPYVIAVKIAKTITYKSNSGVFKDVCSEPRPLYGYFENFPFYNNTGICQGI